MDFGGNTSGNWGSFNAQQSVGGGGQMVQVQGGSDVLNAALVVRKVDVVQKIDPNVKKELQRINNGLGEESQRFKQARAYLSTETPYVKLSNQIEHCERHLNALESEIQQLQQSMSVLESNCVQENDAAAVTEQNLKKYHLRGHRSIEESQFPSDHTVNKIHGFTEKLRSILKACDRLERETLETPTEMSEEKLAQVLMSQQEALSNIAMSVGKVHLSIERIKQRYTMTRGGFKMGRNGRAVTAPLHGDLNVSGSASGGLFGHRPSGFGVGDKENVGNISTTSFSLGKY